jgi:hypothetical protein
VICGGWLVGWCPSGQRVLWYGGFLICGRWVMRVYGHVDILNDWVQVVCEFWALNAVVRRLYEVT